MSKDKKSDQSKELPSAAETPVAGKIPLIIAPMLERGEGEAAADAAEFVEEREAVLDEADVIRGLRG